MAAGQPTVPHDRIAVHLHQPGSGADAVSLGQMFEDRERLLLSQLGAKQGGPLAFGEAALAGAAIQQPTALVFAVEGADGQIPEPAPAMVGTLLVLATEAGEVVRHGVASLIVAAKEVAPRR
jgi:hypothetical protein